MSKIIDNYVLVNSQMKQNYQGEISKARNLITKEYVSIKVVKIDNFVKNPDIREQILNEISINKKLSESVQCIVKIHKMLKSNNHIYIVYEFQEHDLESLIQQINEQEAFQLFKKIVNIYEIISQQEIIHNNLISQNIYINEGEIKFDGFGLARILDQNKQIMTKNNQNQAPEVQKGCLPSQKSDIYQLGKLLQEMVQKKYQYQDLISRLTNEDPSQRMDLQTLKWSLNKFDSKIESYKFQNNYINEDINDSQNNSQFNLLENQYDDLHFYVMKERNKYLMIIKIVQNLIQLNQPDLNKQIECGFIMLKLAKIINTNIINNLVDFENSNLIRFFKNKKNLFEKYKQTSEYGYLLQYLKQEGNELNISYNNYKNQINENLLYSKIFEFKFVILMNKISIKFCKNNQKSIFNNQTISEEKNYYQVKTITERK